MPRIEACRNVTICEDLTALDPCSFNVPISLGFQPDEVIVRNITANGSADSGSGLVDYYVYLIRCDILDYATIGTFSGYGRDDAPQSYTSCPQTVFKINKPISATTFIHFDIFSDPDTLAGAIERTLSVSLDFIKYKEKKRKK